MDFFLWDIVNNSIVKNVDIKTTEYVTVSHVWGSNLSYFDSGISSVSWKVLLSYPDKLINIRRCLRMQYIQYVWIDVLCIDQTDNHAKMRQILNMDTYYRKATCCYICLDDIPSKTFDNVSCATKIPQMIQYFTDDIVELASSSWWDRVWTWQEAILSSSAKIVNVRFDALKVSLTTDVVDLHEFLSVGNVAARININKHNIYNFSNLRKLKMMLDDKANFSDNQLSLRYALSATSNRACSLPNDELYGIASCIIGAQKLHHCHDTSYANIMKILRQNELNNGLCSSLLNIGNSLLWEKDGFDKRDWGYDVDVGGQKIAGRARELHGLSSFTFHDDRITVRTFDKFVFAVKLTKHVEFSASSTTRSFGELFHSEASCEKYLCRTCGLNDLLTRAQEISILYVGQASLNDIKQIYMVAIINDRNFEKSSCSAIFSGCVAGESGIAVMLLHDMDRETYIGWGLMEVNLLILIHRSYSTSRKLSIEISYTF